MEYTHNPGPSAMAMAKALNHSLKTERFEETYISEPVYATQSETKIRGDIPPGLRQAMDMVDLFMDGVKYAADDKYLICNDVLWAVAPKTIVNYMEETKGGYNVTAAPLLMRLGAENAVLRNDSDSLESSMVYGPSMLAVKAAIRGQVGAIIVESSFEYCVDDINRDPVDSIKDFNVAVFRAYGRLKKVVEQSLPARVTITSDLSDALVLFEIRSVSAGRLKQFIRTPESMKCRTLENTIKSLIEHERILKIVLNNISDRMLVLEEIKKTDGGENLGEN